MKIGSSSAESVFFWVIGWRVIRLSQLSCFVISPGLSVSTCIATPRSMISPTQMRTMVLEYESQHLPEQNHPVLNLNIPYMEHMGYIWWIGRQAELEPWGARWNSRPFSRDDLKVPGNTASKLDIHWIGWNIYRKPRENPHQMSGFSANVPLNRSNDIEKTCSRQTF